MKITDHTPRELFEEPDEAEIKKALLDGAKRLLDTGAQLSVDEKLMGHATVVVENCQAQLDFIDAELRRAKNRKQTYTGEDPDVLRQQRQEVRSALADAYATLGLFEDAARVDQPRRKFFKKLADAERRDDQTFCPCEPITVTVSDGLGNETRRRSSNFFVAFRAWSWRHHRMLDTYQCSICGRLNMTPNTPPLLNGQQWAARQFPQAGRGPDSEVLPIA